LYNQSITSIILLFRYIYNTKNLYTKVISNEKGAVKGHDGSNDTQIYQMSGYCSYRVFMSLSG